MVAIRLKKLGLDAKLTCLTSGRLLKATFFCCPGLSSFCAYHGRYFCVNGGDVCAAYTLPGGKRENDVD